MGSTSRGKAPSEVFLLSHGNAGNNAHRLPNIVHMLNLGASVLVYDYQGYGKSEGARLLGALLKTASPPMIFCIT